MSLAATALSATVLTIVYWIGFVLLDPAGVSWVARTVLYACCFAALLFLRQSACSVVPAKSWLMRTAYCILLAVLSYGVNQAQDTLYGPDRLKATLPGWLGGLELWWILCPGIVSVSLAAATAHWLSRRR